MTTCIWKSQSTQVPLFTQHFARLFGRRLDALVMERALTQHRCRAKHHPRPAMSVCTCDVGTCRVATGSDFRRHSYDAGCPALGLRQIASDADGPHGPYRSLAEVPKKGSFGPEQAFLANRPIEWSDSLKRYVGCLPHPVAPLQPVGFRKLVIVSTRHVEGRCTSGDW